MAPCTYRTKSSDIDKDGAAPAGLWDSLATQVAELGYVLDRRDCSPALGYSDKKRLVAIDRDLDDAQAVAVLVHELAHVLLGHTAPEYP